jgi:hypothetical protein
MKLHNALLVIVVVLLGGCTPPVPHVAANTPMFGETKAKWQKIPDGRGRLVIVYPRLPLEGLGMNRDAAVFVAVDDSLKTILDDETFAFIDLPVGQHAASLTPRRFMNISTTVQFSINRGAMTYLKVVSEQLGDIEFKVIDEKTANELLRSTRHMYTEALPFDQQTRAQSF